MSLLDVKLYTKLPAANKYGGQVFRVRRGNPANDSETVAFTTNTNRGAAFISAPAFYIRLDRLKVLDGSIYSVAALTR